jgi:hypothetical protein
MSISSSLLNCRSIARQFQSALHTSGESATQQFDNARAKAGELYANPSPGPLTQLPYSVTRPSKESYRSGLLEWTHTSARPANRPSTPGMVQYLRGSGFPSGKSQVLEDWSGRTYQGFREPQPTRGRQLRAPSTTISGTTAVRYALYTVLYTQAWLMVIRVVW